MSTTSLALPHPVERPSCTLRVLPSWRLASTGHLAHRAVGRLTAVVARLADAPLSGLKRPWAASLVTPDGVVDLGRYAGLPEALAAGDAALGGAL